MELTKAHFLEDLSFRLSDTGELKRSDRNDLPLAKHFAYSIRTLAEFANVEGDPFSVDGWNCFKKAVKIRNRITHPKTDSDAVISEEDLNTVNKGINWAFDTGMLIMEKSPLLGKPKN